MVVTLLRFEGGVERYTQIIAQSMSARVADCDVIRNHTLRRWLPARGETRALLLCQSPRPSAQPVMREPGYFRDTIQRLSV